MEDDISLCRSFQTSPAYVSGENSAKYLDSAGHSTGFEVPDWFGPDIEDATPNGKESEGRENIAQFTTDYPAFSGDLWPRINWSYSDEQGTIKEKGEADIEYLVREIGEELAGFVVPKVGRIADVEEAESIIASAEETYGLADESLKMSVIIETPRSFSDLREIGIFGDESRLSGLLFGTGDYTFSMGGRMTDGQFPDWLVQKLTISNEASANNLLAIGGTHPKIYHEHSGKRHYAARSFRNMAQFEAANGFDGSWTLHPNQTVQANHIHLPDPDDIREILSNFETFTGSPEDGVILLDGNIVDIAMYTYWKDKLQTVKVLFDRKEAQAQKLYDASIQKEVITALEDI